MIRAGVLQYRRYYDRLRYRRKAYVEMEGGWDGCAPPGSLTLPLHRSHINLINDPVILPGGPRFHQDR